MLADALAPPFDLGDFDPIGTTVLEDRLDLLVVRARCRRAAETPAPRPSHLVVSAKPHPPGQPCNPRWRHTFGRAAEELAARYLEGRGCVILARRFAFRRGEVDLIVDDAGVVAFVEVKARRGERFGAAVEAVNARKQRRIVATARRFLGQRSWRGRRCRFDVVTVQTECGRAQVSWLRDAFRP